MTAKNSLHEKAEQLRCRLRDFGRVGIAFSGGVDSSFLLHAAIDALGAENVFALHARSCLQTQEEQNRAMTEPVRVVAIEPLVWPDFVRNPPNRCYLCKRHLYQLFLDMLAENGIFVLSDGTNADDLQQGEAGRPGLRAIAELCVQTPLADCGLGKAEIRDLSLELGLDTWNQPAASCLATRIPAGMEITAERLTRVAAMEQLLAEAGFSDCRARLLDEETVGLQLRREDFDHFYAPAVRHAVCGLLKSKGAGKILLDLDGR